jgi:hypothetical protein
MTEKDYLVDATTGPSVKVEDYVYTGQELGKDTAGEPVFAEFDGQVSSVRFNGIEHVFIVTVMGTELT